MSSVSVPYMHSNIFLLQLSKLYKLNQSSTMWKKIMHYSIRIIYSTFLLLLLVSFALDIKTKGQFNATALSYVFFCVTLTVAQRNIYYSIYNDKTEKLIVKMNDFFMHETSTGLEEKSMEEYLRISKKLTYGWLFYGELAGIVFGLAPLFYSNVHNRVLPLPLWLPYDWKSSPNYEMTYFAEITSLVIMSLTQAATDMFYATIILLTSKQFELLGWEFKNLVYTCLLQNGLSKEVVYKFREKFNDYKSATTSDTKRLDLSDVYATCSSYKFNKSILNRFNRLVQFHQKLLSFCVDLEDFFSPLMLIYYLVIMALSLFLNFVIITSRDLSCITLCLAAYFQIFFPCFLANTLSTQAERLQMDLYDVPWYICGKEFRINIEFLLHKVQTPITITVGKFSNLDLYLFLWSVRTLNSYSIILYQLTQPR